MSDRKEPFNFGDIVCLKVDPSDVGIVVSIVKHMNNSTQYGVSWASATHTVHFAGELNFTEPKEEEL